MFIYWNPLPHILQVPEIYVRGRYADAVVRILEFGQNLPPRVNDDRVSVALPFLAVNPCLRRGDDVALRLDRPRQG